MKKRILIFYAVFLIFLSAIISAENTIPVTVIWPTPGYYYITDAMQLNIETPKNMTCYYTMDNGNTIQIMKYTHDLEHFQWLTDLADNMNGEPYLIIFSCVDESGNTGGNFTHFKINLTDLDNYFIRNDLGQWNYIFSELTFINITDVVTSYSSYYNKQGTDLYNSVSLLIFVNESSIKDYINNALNKNNFTIKNMNNEIIYITESDDDKVAFWKNSNRLVISVNYPINNSTQILSEYPEEILNPYIQKYPSDIVICTPKWIKNNNKCQTNNKRLISYYDSNKCNLNKDLPKDNGTYADCDYCTAKIQGPIYTQWLNCNNQSKTRIKYYKDINYSSCCLITKLSSDCIINDNTYQNITEKENCFDFKIIEPKEKVYNNGKINLIINSNSDIAKLETMDYLDENKNPKKTLLCTGKNCQNYNKMINFNYGSHRLVIKGTSDKGLIYINNVSFFIDNKEPRIMLTEPKSNSFSNGSEFLIKYEELNLKNITLIYGSDKIIKTDCLSGKTPICIFHPSLDKYNGQVIQYYFVIFDVAGNKVQSKPIKIHVDTTSPTINNLNSFWSQSGKYIIFNISIKDNNFDSIEYIENNNPKSRWLTICSSLNKGYCIKKLSFNKGSHNLTVNILDKAGNSIKKDISFSV